MLEIQFTRKHVDRFKKLEILAVYLFGSRAEGNVHPLSDVDIGVVFENPKRHIDKTMSPLAVEMGRQKIVPMEFAEEKLYKMAGYRNRLTHFYFEISPKEMHEIIQNKLDDFRALLKYFKKLIEK